MTVGNNSRPVIIKKKKVFASDGHHGGAWKVAYADFVTAMMAFFMLMWLLNATTEQQRKGIADYFSPTIPITRISGGGDGSFGGDSAFSERAAAQNGTGATSLRPTAGRQALGTHENVPVAQAEEEALREFQASFLNALADEMASGGALEASVLTRLSDEGLVIEFFERDGFPLFSEGGNRASDWLAKMFQIVGNLLNTVSNDIAVATFVAAEPAVRSGPSPWDRSLDNGRAVKELLKFSGVEPSRIVRVTGFADREPITQDPMKKRNNRIEVIVLIDL